MECLAALSLLQARSLVLAELYRRSRSLLTRIVAMLTRLARRDAASRRVATTVGPQLEQSSAVSCRYGRATK